VGSAKGRKIVQVSSSASTDVLAMAPSIYTLGGWAMATVGDAVKTDAMIANGQGEDARAP